MWTHASKATLHVDNLMDVLLDLTIMHKGGLRGSNGMRPTLSTDIDRVASSVGNASEVGVASKIRSTRNKLFLVGNILFPNVCFL